MSCIEQTASFLEGYSSSCLHAKQACEMCTYLLLELPIFQVSPVTQLKGQMSRRFSTYAGGELGELTLADMIAPLGQPEGKLTKAQKQLKQLAKKAQAVKPPLPGPIRARKERQAGYIFHKHVLKHIPQSQACAFKLLSLHAEVQHLIIAVKNRG